MTGTSERSSTSRATELMVTLWLLATLLAELILVVWFFGRMYST